MEIQVFRNELGAIRVIGEHNNPLFCLNDVCKALEIKNQTDVKNAIKAEFGEKIDLIYPLKTNGGIQNFTMITEPQLYFVLMRSDKPKAKPFRRWVTSEVLPSIRKNGHYETQAHKAYQRDSFDEILKALKSISSEHDRAKEENLKIKEQNNSLKDELLSLYREQKTQTKETTIRSRFLTESEKQKIRELYKDGLSYATIARAIGRSDNGVAAFIKNDKFFGEYLKKNFDKGSSQGRLL